MFPFSLFRKIQVDRLRIPLFITVAVLLFGWLLNTPEGLLGKADAIGYAVCHRIDLRSFHLGDRQLPLCARCSGMYLGALTGLVLQAIIAPRRGGMPGKWMLVVLAVLVLAFGVDGTNSFVHLLPEFPYSLYEPNNTLRVLTGSGMGLVMAVVLYPAFNQSVWQQWDARPALADWKAMVYAIALVLLVDAAVLSENTLLLYPLAVLSALTVLLLLALIYSMLLLMAFRAENRYTDWAQLVVPLLGGFLLALMQIGGIDAVRYGLTQTWDGFHFGALLEKPLLAIHVNKANRFLSTGVTAMLGGAFWKS